MHKVGFLLEEGFQVMALSTQAVFESANLTFGEKFYQVENYSMQGGDIRSSLGMVVQTRAVDEHSTADTWIVGGVNDPMAAPASQAKKRFLQNAAFHAKRMAAICSGAFYLAEAGLLANKTATTHWALAGDMQQRFSDVHIDANRIYVADGNIWTSAGMTAGLDLALAMVEQDLGSEVARSVAHKLVMSQKRSGGQSQHSERVDLSPKSSRIQNALEYARRNLKGSLTVDDLAAAVHLSPRQFSRVFRQETGHTPAKAVEGMRLEAARLLIEQSRQTLDVIAKETGFRDRRHMREVFIRGFGIPPQILRQGARLG
ncbi:MAG: GlxA family transcriptional regulator [Pseudomonadota bacterium]|uniref:AraC family transcriptional regulator with amidase-like domain n=1 Tax=Gallaecimonas pentaromativorans TaxID=584787 RepID=A0A3N1PB35_9GAMM|nr:GlxA family transcriptional regulator [Gallaecimonas pentaromativorans]MED5526497.1 GlxA family transcriptional regulator [Pseudomonadota bacterium]ROQ25835.1 AraC family transcriptional regulator with amidase-like domain [Gallaecimonas pentaromativorans]